MRELSIAELEEVSAADGCIYISVPGGVIAICEGASTPA
jgi:hypothetical protein